MHSTGMMVPAVAVALTFQSEPLPRVPDVYRLAAPVVELQDPAPAPRSRRKTYIGALVGAGVGCGFGAWVSKSSDYAAAACIIGMGAGAAGGAIAGTILRRSP